MDKNTVIGLVIIGVILSVFTIFNQPTEEELKEKQAKTELAEKRKKENEKNTSNELEKSDSSTSDATAGANSLVAKLGEDGKQLESEGLLVFTDTLTKKDTLIAPVTSKEAAIQTAVEGEIIRMENEKLIVDFDTKGGQIASVQLKEFQSYKDYAKNYNAAESE